MPCGGRGPAHFPARACRGRSDGASLAGVSAPRRARVRREGSSAFEDRHRTVCPRAGGHPVRPGAVRRPGRVAPGSAGSAPLRFGASPDNQGRAARPTRRHLGRGVSAREVASHGVQRRGARPEAVRRPRLIRRHRRGERTPLLWSGNHHRRLARPAARRRATGSSPEAPGARCRQPADGRSKTCRWSGRGERRPVTSGPPCPCLSAGFPWRRCIDPDVRQHTGDDWRSPARRSPARR